MVRGRVRSDRVRRRSSSPRDARVRSRRRLIVKVTRNVYFMLDGVYGVRRPRLCIWAVGCGRENGEILFTAVPLPASE